MRFSLPALAGALAVNAGAPEIGLESTVFASAVEAYRVGTIFVDASGNAVYIPKPGITLPALGYDLHLRCDTGVAGVSVVPSVTLNVTLGDDTAGTAIASLGIPGYVPDQSKVWPVGEASDFIPQGVGNGAKLVKAISAISASAGLGTNTEWGIFASPAASSFVQLGWKRQANIPYDVPGVVALPDGYRAVGASKKGRGEQPTYSFQFGHVSSMGGMARYYGHRISVLEKIVKDKVAHTANLLVIGFRPTGSPDRGDGNDEVVESSEGFGEEHLIFNAA